MALCTNNITDFTVKEIVAGSDDYTNLVGAYVCQSTIIPSESKGFRAALSSQSIILADTFLGKLRLVPVCMHAVILNWGHQILSTGNLSLCWYLP